MHHASDAMWQRTACEARVLNIENMKMTVRAKPRGAHQRASDAYGTATNRFALDFRHFEDNNIAYLRTSARSLRIRDGVCRG